MASYNQTAAGIISSLNADSLGYPWYHSNRQEFIPGCSDARLALLLPIAFYWVTSLTYHYLDISGWKWIEKHRVQTTEDADKKNMASRTQVIMTVFRMQAWQAGLGAIWQIFFKNKDVVKVYINHSVEMQKAATFVVKWLSKAVGEQAATNIMTNYGAEIAYFTYWYAGPIVRVGAGAIILDTYQYWVHRLFHTVPFLYKHVHSLHHRLYVPFAYGSQYNHPIEGGVADAISGILATNITRMYEREVVLLLSFIAYKSVEDHCGYQWPWHPLRWFSLNDAEFHEIHHMHAGLKYNFSQPLFVMWDKAMGTYIDRQQLEDLKAAKKTARKVKSQ